MPGDENSGLTLVFRHQHPTQAHQPAQALNIVRRVPMSQVGADIRRVTRVPAVELLDPAEEARMDRQQADVS